MSSPESSAFQARLETDVIRAIKPLGTQTQFDMITSAGQPFADENSRTQAIGAPHNLAPTRVDR